MKRRAEGPPPAPPRPRRRYPPSIFAMPPAPLEPPSPKPCWPTTDPSDGWTSTQPCPPKASWNDSPDPLPISVFKFTSVLTDCVTPDDQQIAACASAKVGA